MRRLSRSQVSDCRNTEKIWFLAGPCTHSNNSTTTTHHVQKHSTRPSQMRSQTSTDINLNVSTTIAVHYIRSPDVRLSKHTSPSPADTLPHTHSATQPQTNSAQAMLLTMIETSITLPNYVEYVRQKKNNMNEGTHVTVTNTNRTCACTQTRHT